MARNEPEGVLAGPEGVPLRTQARRRRGQTAIIALLVLLLLSFVGGLFVTIVANNLRTQGRSHRTLNADYYAEAGLRYADDQLTNSPDGADWRPPLQNTLLPADVTTLIGATTTSAYKRYMAQGLSAPNQQDPDYNYLVQGFTRYDTENGRFLLRVSYDPQDIGGGIGPTHYLKIESVGREGVVVPTDPTTYTNQPATRLAATLVAYKPIGITDYARFETNKDNRSDVMNVGVPSTYVSTATQPSIVTPGVYDFSVSGTGTNQTVALQQFPVTTTYGNPATGGGGSFHANGSVRFYGINDFYLSQTAPLNDDVEIAGRILLDNYNPATSSLTSGQFAAIVLNPPATGTTPSADYVAPTNGFDTANSQGVAFDTHGGQVRDGGTGADTNDAGGNPRSIARLDPPVIDNVNPATSLTRYQDITENSPTRQIPGINGSADADTAPANPNVSGQNGFGQAIYVNNTSDVQPESTSLVGGHTLVDEWLNRNGGGQPASNAKSGWDGPFYNPPGVDVTCGLQQQNIGGTVYSYYGVRLTRSDVDSNGNPNLWKDPTDPTDTKTLGPTLTVSYHDLNASNDPTTVPAAGIPAFAAYHANPNNDVVIYCEGNVRIKPSLLSAPPTEAAVDTKHNEPSRLYQANTGGTDETDDKLPRHITIVTNGTAYIEGSIIKGNPDSSLTVLARDYVCLNTTQFYGGALADQNPQSTQPPAASAADSTLLDFGAQNDVLVQDLNFNTNYTNTTKGNYGTGPGSYALYISGGPSASGETQAQFDIINPATGLGIMSGGLPFDNPLGSPIFNTIGSASSGASSLTRISFDLTSNPAITALQSTVTPFLPLQLWTRLDPNPTPIAVGVSVADQDYVQERSAILPMDIEIDAVLYAQDKSFFVIPGPWFNSDSSDNLQTYTYGYTNSNKFNVLPSFRNGQGPTVIDPGLARFPFYGQPVDLRITIKGSVSENLPADISAQAAWMAKWGWIPQYHGGEALYPGDTNASFELSGHPAATSGQPATGLDLVYDPSAGNPYDTTSNSYMRTDLYGRPLPFTPKLPVSTGLIYAGQSDPQSLLQ